MVDNETVDLIQNLSSSDPWGLRSLEWPERPM